jgi:Copper type II ascorbate-dependent monooxygenase, C-terminal domain
MRSLLASIILATAIIGCGGMDPEDPPTLDGEKFALSFGPVMVQPGQENTQCIQARLSNTTPIKVHNMHNVLQTGSHHLIVYRDDMTTAETAAPFDCQPFTGALNPSGMVAPIMITQRQDDALYMPDGVAYTLAANQMMRIEMHYINTTDAPLEVSAVVELYAAPEGSIHSEANILFIGSPDINIPAGGQMTLEQFFTPSRAQLDLTDANFFAITGHTHRLGTKMEVSTAPTNGGARTMVYAPDPFQWAEPATVTHAPEFKIPDGQGGFNFKCQYANTSSQSVGFGESANDEMCFFWAYYYPSKGSHVCFHTNDFGSVDVCCPDAGPQLCNQINNMF